ncbi:MAG: glycosyltransferase family 2 protein [Bacillota bacterium]
MKKKISAAIITLNEEKNLPRCLKSIGWVDEIVVVDSGSTDRTVEIAKSAGASVHHNPWPGYARQWQKAIQLCSHPWVLLMAADQVVDRALSGEIMESLASPGEVRGFILNYKHFFLGKWIEHCGWYPAPALQIFRKDSVRVIHREVHESFTVSPYIVKPLRKGFMEHYTYHSIHQYLEKFNRYTDLDAREMAKNKPGLSANDMVISGLRKFNDMFFRQEGYRDGLHGLVLCVLSALYEFVAAAKYLEIRGDFDNQGDPS